MGETTGINWTDSTFNPWVGCTKVGPGCDHCYAEGLMDKRHHRVAWGAGNARSRTSAANWKLPMRWNAGKFYECAACGVRSDKVSFADVHGHLTEDARCIQCGIAAVSGARRRVFCASLADVFDNEVDPAWRADLFNLILATPNLDWLLLTKRIGNARQMILDACTGRSHEWPLPNIWLGATVVNQEEADRDIPKLLRVPARVRFLSVEPMLGPVDISRWLAPLSICKACDAEHEGMPETCPACGEDSLITTWGEWQADRLRTRERYENNGPSDDEDGPQLQWVIAGGESGHHARPSHPDWYRRLRDQCAAAGTPFLLKQWGEWLPVDHVHSGRLPDAQAFSHTGAHEWPDRTLSIKVGKKAAGRLLDGAEHNSFPASAG